MISNQREEDASLTARGPELIRSEWVRFRDRTLASWRAAVTTGQVVDLTQMYARSAREIGFRDQINQSLSRATKKGEG